MLCMDSNIFKVKYLNYHVVYKNKDLCFFSLYLNKHSTYIVNGTVSKMHVPFPKTCQTSCEGEGNLHDQFWGD